MPVIMNGKKIIPAPFVSISKVYDTTEDGTVVGTTFSLVVKGKVVAHKGSPNAAGVLWDQSGYPPDDVLTADQHLGALLRKQEALRKLFSVQGATFEVQPLDGSTSLKCNPRIKGPIQFTEGLWFNTFEYTIQMEADIVYGLVTNEDTGDPINYKVSKASDEWHIEAADERARSYRLTHNVSAVGKKFYNDTGSLVQPAWNNAKDYVLNKLTLGLRPDRMSASGVLNASELQAFNYIRSQNLNELAGTFQATETWLCFDPQGQPPAIEEFTINARTNENGVTHATIEGQIQGLEVRDNNTHALISTRFTNASSKWTSYVNPYLKTRCETYTGLTMRALPVTTQVGYNDFNGIITYNSEFDNRADFLTSGALSEIVTIDDDNPVDVFASIPVLGRAAGPVLQQIPTITARKRTINIEIQMKGKSQSFTPTKPNTDTIVSNNTPTGSVVFLDTNRENWSEYTGRYTRTVGFTWEA